MKYKMTRKVSGLSAAVLLAALIIGRPAVSSAWDLSYLNYLLRIRYPAGLIYYLEARDLNGIFLNGQYLDDHYIAGVSLNNVRVSRNRITSLWLNGTAFSYGHIEGAEFSATVDDGSQLTVRIDSVRRIKYGAPRDVLHYLVSYASDEGWKPLCGTDSSGAPIAAIPLLGRWDYSVGTETGGARIEDSRSFTFACDGFVIEKCVAAGYKPWASVFVCKDYWHCEWVSLKDYHQTCTRVLRADFCGDGISYTEDNVLIALYDGLGIRVDTENWISEAEWDEDGAVCANSSRIPSMTPTCAPSLVDETCGDKSHFADGILMISELP